MNFSRLRVALLSLTTSMMSSAKHVVCVDTSFALVGS